MSASLPPSSPPPPSPGQASPQAYPPGSVPGAGPGWVAPTDGGGKSRVIAILLALLLGGLGIHKFYLGKVLLGVLYLLFVWTGIPSFIAWIEAILYLVTSDEDWARKHGGPVQRSSGAAIGCLWLLAILPLFSLIAIVALTALLFLGSSVTYVNQ